MVGNRIQTGSSRRRQRRRPFPPAPPCAWRSTSPWKTSAGKYCIRKKILKSSFVGAKNYHFDSAPTPVWCKCRLPAPPSPAVALRRRDQFQAFPGGLVAFLRDHAIFYAGQRSSLISLPFCEFRPFLCDGQSLINYLRRHLFFSCQSI